MASQEARQLCHILAALNYDGQQTLVTPESFSKPNFDLVCDLLGWFARIVDDKYVSAGDFGGLTTGERRMSEVSDSGKIALLANLAELIVSKLGVQPNLVALYRADSASCPELLKIAEPIYRAARLAVGGGGSDTKWRAIESSLSKKMANLMGSIESALELVGHDETKGNNDERLASEASELAGELERLLANEETFNEERRRVMERRLELADIEQVLRNAHNGVVAKTKELACTNEELEKDLIRLDERLAAKEVEVNDARQRLNDLLVQSPTYVHQFERLRNQYELAYENYVSKFRSLMYLKSCVYSSNYNVNTVTTTANQLERTKPGGSPAAAESSFRGAAGAGATAADTAPATGRGPGSGTTGPARLLESLFEGTSNPMSASAIPFGPTDSGSDAAFRAGASGGGRGSRAEVTGLRGYDWRPAVAGDATGLELEGLLNEFVADAVGVDGTEPGADGLDDDDDGGGGDSGDGGSTDDDDDDNDDDDDDDDDGDGEGDNDNGIGKLTMDGLRGAY